MTGGLSCSSSSTSCRPGCSSRSRCSCRCRWACRRWRPGCASCRCRSRCSLAAVGHPAASSRRPRRAEWSAAGCSRMFAGIVVLFAALDVDAGPEIVTVPLLLAGLGIGALASQLGAVTVSAVPDEREPGGRGPAEHRDEPGRGARHRAGGVDPHRRAERRVPARHPGQPGDPAEVSAQASVELAGGVPFISDADLQAALQKAGVPPTSRRCSDRGQQGGAGGGPARGHRRPGADRVVRAVLHQLHADPGAGTISGVGACASPCAAVR